MRIFFSGILFIVSMSLVSVLAYAQTETVQDDSLLVSHTFALPVIDGIGDDSCWRAAKWQSIGKVWIPFNGSVAESDYTGRYKVIWSSESNLLYFLIDIYDDVFVDGYVPSRYGGSYKYDITEVFIDENHSGGEHRYDGSTTDAENAFAYHMYTDYPVDGEVNAQPYIEDMKGTQTNSTWVDHASHFPEFVLRKDGNTAVREFSLIVYNNTYTEENKDAAIADLYTGKEMGLSVAYCDNDHPEKNPVERDNMFGSVDEPYPGNLHWINADYFGTVELAGELSTGINYSNTHPVKYELHQNFPNPFNPTTSIGYQISRYETVTLKVYDVLGREIEVLVNEKKSPGVYKVQFDGSALASGVYCYKLQTESEFIEIKKFILLK
ncbi:MAG: T9SS type A sorting domain-containing protein [Melioribacteraceae bacterium]|nr:T9SS type A sorting domain-containing protein [Melioribacteraceae bacterium]